MEGGGRSADKKGVGGIDFGFGDNAIHVHRKNIREEMKNREKYDSLPQEMKDQVRPL